jgi:sn1-specific diacylglycerol lipase
VRPETRSEAHWFHIVNSHGIVDELLAEPRHEGYTLRLTGHSLGAGTAAILSFFLRHKYAGLKCSCFCPPGCSVSSNMAEECKDYLTSYVLDHDIVPRMSVGSLENLRKGMLDMLARLKVTKFQATHAGPQVDQNMLLHRQDSIPPSKFKEQLDEFLERREEVIALRDVRTVPLYPPGKLVQLVKTADDTPPTGCCSSAAVEVQDTPYMARWAHVEDLSEIILSSHFLDDHSTVNVLREIERTAGVFGLSGPTFTVQQEDTTESRPLWRNQK